MSTSASRALDPANRGLSLGHVDGLRRIGRIRPEQDDHLQGRHREIGLAPDSISREVQTHALEALRLRGRETQLVLVIQDHREQRPGKWRAGHVPGEARRSGTVRL